MNKVLIRRSDSFIREFKLKCSKYDSFHVNGWTLAALRCGVRELHLCVTARQQQSFKLTTDVFAFQQLEHLKLGGKFVLHVPKSVCLPKLEDLFLDSIEFSDDESIRRLCSSCPVLAMLRVEHCGFKDIRVFSVSAPALKFLKIGCSFSNNDDYSTEFCDYEIVVDSPALTYLWYSDFVARDYTLGNLQCLLDVFIDVDVRRGEGIDVVRRGLVLLNGISNSKSLTLSGLSVAVQVWSIEEFKWNPPPQVPECLLLHLKEVVIKRFILQEDLLKLIKYLSENARVLKKVSELPESYNSWQLKIGNSFVL